MRYLLFITACLLSGVASAGGTGYSFDDYSVYKQYGDLNPKSNILRDARIYDFREHKKIKYLLENYGIYKPYE